jgi:hypothetical protein
MNQGGSDVIPRVVHRSGGDALVMPGIAAAQATPEAAADDPLSSQLVTAKDLGSG